MEKKCDAAFSSVLCVKSHNRLQEILIRDGKNLLCHGDEHQKASPLF
jgi:hypothetical protein